MSILYVMLAQVPVLPLPRNVYFTHLHDSLSFDCACIYLASKKAILISVSLSLCLQSGEVCLSDGEEALGLVQEDLPAEEEGGGQR